MASHRPLQSAVLAEAWEVTGTQPSPTGRLHLMADGTLRNLDNGTIADFHVYTLEWDPGEFRWAIDGNYLNGH